MSDSDEFKLWMKACDRLLLGTVGLTTSDLADAPYYDHFEAGTDPKTMCAIVLVEWNDYPADLAESLGFTL